MKIFCLCFLLAVFCLCFVARSTALPKSEAMVLGHHTASCTDNCRHGQSAEYAEMPIFASDATIYASASKEQISLNNYVSNDKTSGFGFETYETKSTTPGRIIAILMFLVSIILGAVVVGLLGWFFGWLGGLAFAGAAGAAKAGIKGLWIGAVVGGLAAGAASFVPLLFVFFDYRG